jgi:hypothetical protein
MKETVSGALCESKAQTGQGRPFTRTYFLGIVFLVVGVLASITADHFPTNQWQFEEGTRLSSLGRRFGDFNSSPKSKIEATAVKRSIKSR